MPEELSVNAAPDVSPINRLIGQTRRLLRSSWLATGLGLTVGLFVGALAAVTALDLVFPLPTWLRLAALLVVVVPSTWALLVGVVLPLCRRLRAGDVARRIEGHIPGIHNRLVSCIDLSHSALSVLQDDGIVKSLPYFVMIVIVAATAWYQQRQIQGRNPNAAAANPQQQMITKLVPFIFVPITLSIQAGVVIYFVVSNLVRVGQQALVTKLEFGEGGSQTEIVKPTPATPPPKPTRAAKGSSGRTTPSAAAAARNQNNKKRKRK